MNKWLVTTRSDTGNVIDAVIAHTLLKAEEATASQVFDLSQKYNSPQFLRNQNSALNYDGMSYMEIDVGHCKVTVEPIVEND